MRLRRVIASGALGGAVLAAMLVGAPGLLGLDVWPGPAAVVTGAVVMLAVGAASALAYALAFEHVLRRAGWRTGAALGLLHGATLAAALALLPWIAERWMRLSITALVSAPYGITHRGPALAVAVGAGVGFGALVGAAYGTPRPRADAERHVAWRELHPGRGRSGPRD